MAWSNKTKTIVWISIGAVLLIILIIVLSSGKSKAETPPKQLPPDSDKDVNKKPAPSSDQAPKEIFPLKYGKRGKEVEQAQIYLLKEWGAQFPKFGIDGVWKQETEDNMVKFLKKNSISKDFYLKTGMDKIKTVNFK